MHVSGNLMKDNVTEQVKPYKRFFDPGGKSEGESEK